MGLEMIILASLGFFIVTIQHNCIKKNNKSIINLLLLFVSSGCF